MDGGDSSPVMTDSERRAYRYGHRAAPRPRGMRQSWSNDSLAGYGGRASCVCAPTTHPGSFRCKHHRHHASNLGAAAASPAAPDADAKHDEAQGTAPDADQQADKSS
ncbi:uncharacterized protein LOC120652539 [Panicum virgatum]|jgi:hypothetical protein|uniref:Uncharacterized protein n=1 Tax=Panicum virgatum TaxID=38727 RepID=A0A8T0NYW2_PANVG|nr:uncharacterized protein LOC120652539 [Panicum virgatum]KAG2552316.1 hypothetical protein PVAP13_9KG424900 [Panicum virgatum]